MNDKNYIPSRTSPKGGRRGCLCWETSTYSIECCDGSVRAQGVGSVYFTDEDSNLPINLTPPVISGTAERGETLTSTTGTWSGTGTITFAYQWKRDNLNISGATSSTYVLVADDDNTSITCVVTATDDVGSTNSSSNAISPILGSPYNLVAPVASGTGQVGQTLSTTNGSWQGIATITFTYQWRRDASDISGATSSTYTLVADDYATDIDCMVTATNGLGSANQDSNDIANIAGSVPVISGVPTISGTAKVGEILTATAASVTGTPTPTDTFQWQRSDDGSTGWANVSGATSTTYTAVSADEGKFLRVVQTSTNEAGSDTANSASTTQVQPSFTGILDTYSGATAAYSLRLLRSGYSGSAIRVRRADDNAEQDIGFRNNELDTSTLATFSLGSDCFITTWYEQSGASGAANLTQSTASNQPKIYDGATSSVVLENGKPTIDFDYTSTQHFSATPTNWSSIVDDTNHTLSMVYNLNQYNSPRSTLYSIANEVSGGEGDTLIAMARSAGLRIGFFDKSVGSITKAAGFISTIGGAQNGVQYVVTSIYDTTDLNSFANSTIEDNNTSNPEAPKTANKFFIGANSNSANPMDGNLQEFIIWNVDQTTNRSGIETNINDYYSIY
ncbi:hypothetical protein N9Z17_04235 [Planktomarina temperata]|nr:hypothetical protein [Planktomarina temperata]